MLKALIIDDEDSTRDILKNYIPWYEIGIDSINEASNGFLALDLALKIKPDIILSDVRMPKMNGIEFAERISQIFPECKIIFLSAYSDKEYLKSAIKLKAVNYIEKPINLDEIIQVLKHAVVECANEKDNKLQNIQAAQQTLICSLTAPIKDMDGILRQIKGLNVNFPENCAYISCLIRIYPDESQQMETCSKHVLARLKDIMEEYSDLYIYMMKGENLILLCFNTGSGLDVSNLINELTLLISEANNGIKQAYKIFIALGSEVNSLQNIYTSYQSAVVTLYKQFFYGYNKLVTYSPDDSLPFTFNEAILRDFSENLKLHKEMEAILTIKRLVSGVRNRTNTLPELVREFFYKLTLEMYKFADKMNIPLIGENSQNKLTKLASTATLAELEEITLELLRLIFSHLDGCNTSHDLVIKATNFINENFTDPDLSIQFIAKKLYVTPNYLSTLFKKATGKTISQYLTDIRIEKALELLKNSDCKLYDIAKSVGYNDGKYFSKVFEKAVGIKPKIYRGL